MFFDSKRIIERKTKAAHPTSNEMPALHRTIGNILGMTNHSLLTNATIELEENYFTILDPTTQRITSCDKCILIVRHIPSIYFIPSKHQDVKSIDRTAHRTAH